jgi:hypothetical protein
MQPFLHAAAFVLLGCLVANPALAGENKGFHLTIDGTAVDVDPGDSIDVTTGDGKTHTIRLERNDTVNFAGAKFSFDHDGQFTVARSDLSGGVVQYALITPIGTGVIVQEYKGMNPSTFTDFMLQQMVQESIDAGARMDKQPLQRTLAGGEVLKGVKAETSTDSDVMDYEVVAIGHPEGGIIVATFINKANSAKENVILDKLWSSLKTSY